MSKDKKDKVLTGRFTMSVTITEDEAKAVLREPRSTTARNLRKYMYSILQEASKKMLDKNINENKVLEQELKRD